tara:strand:- start:465 stop:992 length:528 start_codon:yes stop_codon:yes gene_type:complete
MPAPAVAAAGLRGIPWLLRLLSKGGKAGRFVGRELPILGTRAKHSARARELQKQISKGTYGTPRKKGRFAGPPSLTVGKGEGAVSTPMKQVMDQLARHQKKGAYGITGMRGLAIGGGGLMAADLLGGGGEEGPSDEDQFIQMLLEENSPMLEQMAAMQGPPMAPPRSPRRTGMAG